ncbi:hypothetical protein Nepgr_005371 [Nepenthes gracilis]|uniref:Uncharacterized protein n=1 Tax=Nepenthes gracilis TaxID=150966 RepID=A0AAD3S321_NEPGR|nr:hypothetical protein Nepgr_005371 [Nepenthes gracilis]
MAPSTTTAQPLQQLSSSKSKRQKTELDHPHLQQITPTTSETKLLRQRKQLTKCILDSKALKIHRQTIKIAYQIPPQMKPHNISPRPTQP